MRSRRGGFVRAVLWAEACAAACERVGICLADSPPATRGVPRLRHRCHALRPEAGRDERATKRRVAAADGGFASLPHDGNVELRSLPPDFQFPTNAVRAENWWRRGAWEDVRRVEFPQGWGQCGDRPQKELHFYSDSASFLRYIRRATDASRQPCVDQPTLSAE